MDEELIFNYSYMWSYRPILNSVYGKARKVEAFYQYFLIGDIKGELQPSHFEKVVRAAEYAKKILDDAIEKNYDTECIETKIPEILRILDLDALITVPLSVPKRGPGLAVTEQDLVKALSKIAKHRENDLGKVDPKSAIEGHQPFFTDVKKTIKTRIVILLDHSSSISADQLEYKKATLALCEVLSYLKVKFAVYAFNTEQKQVVCWMIKPENMKWNYVAAKRLAQIIANGGTPLAEVYDKMYPILRSKKPDIFLTLSDGSP